MSCEQLNFGNQHAVVYVHGYPGDVSLTCRFSMCSMSVGMFTPGEARRLARLLLDAADIAQYGERQTEMVVAP